MMSDTYLPFSTENLSTYIPPISTVFVYKVCDNYTFEAIIQVHDKWYKQTIVLRNILPICGTSTVDETIKLHEYMQDLLSFRNILLCNVSYGANGSLLADVDVAGLHINSEINNRVACINCNIEKRYAESRVGKWKAWFNACLASIRAKIKERRECNISLQSTQCK